jgi:hypothetical protein
VWNSRGFDMRMKVDDSEDGLDSRESEGACYSSQLVSSDI